MYNQANQNVLDFFSFSLGMRSAFDLRGDLCFDLLNQIVAVDDQEALMSDWKKIGDDIYFAMETFDDNESKRVING